MEAKPEFAEFPTYPNGTLKVVLINLAQIATITEDAGRNEIVVRMSNGDSHPIGRDTYMKLRTKIQISAIAEQGR